MKKAPELRNLQTARTTRTVKTLDYTFFKKGELVQGRMTSFGEFLVTEGVHAASLWRVAPGYFELL